MHWIGRRLMVPARSQFNTQIPTFKNPELKPPRPHRTTRKTSGLEVPRSNGNSNVKGINTYTAWALCSWCVVTALDADEELLGMSVFAALGRSWRSSQRAVYASKWKAF